MDVFNNDLLLSFAAVSVERFEECSEGSGELARLVQIFTPKLKSLAWKHRSSITFHRWPILISLQSLSPNDAKASLCRNLPTQDSLLSDCWSVRMSIGG
jgi:hypothetical protein